MNGNLQVGNLFGIPFYVNVSWFLVLALVTWNYGSGLANSFAGLTGVTPWVLGLLTALLLFASVLAHELGHSFVALRQGINVNSITLFLFGGLAALEKESDTPRGAFGVAIAGPAVSLALFATLFTIGTVFSLSGPVGAIVSVLAYVNLALGVFNLLPGLPLDGGNVVKSIVWKLTGNPYKGLAFASRAGQVIGWLGVGLGAASILGLTTFGNVWTLLVGWFLLQNANRSAQTAEVQSRLEGLTAADAIAPNSPIVAADLSLREFADRAVLSVDHPWSRYLVVDADDRLVGTLSVECLRTIPRDRWAETSVGAVMSTQESPTPVDSNRPLLDVVRLLEEKQLSVLAVIRDNGALMGLLEKTRIIRLIQQSQGRNPAPYASLIL
ncbi:MAG: site-2 protease family protein [Leptolyngbyaceae cyanobacterium T60_A2020_046]|nr:site-2 protease family protein [Leptolyngbyaceae cyanobacterium T60_A2020_046]